jgi:hypothetical protein
MEEMNKSQATLGLVGKLFFYPRSNKAFEIGGKSAGSGLVQ